MWAVGAACRAWRAAKFVLVVPELVALLCFLDLHPSCLQLRRLVLPGAACMLYAKIAPKFYSHLRFSCSYDGWLCLMSRNVREPAVLFAMHLMVPDHPGVMRWVQLARVMWFCCGMQFVLHSFLVCRASRWLQQCCGANVTMRWRQRAWLRRLLHFLTMPLPLDNLCCSHYGNEAAVAHLAAAERELRERREREIAEAEEQVSRVVVLIKIAAS